MSVCFSVALRQRLTRHIVSKPHRQSRVIVQSRVVVPHRREIDQPVQRFAHASQRPSPQIFRSPDYFHALWSVSFHFRLASGLRAVCCSLEIHTRREQFERFFRNRTQPVRRSHRPADDARNTVRPANPQRQFEDPARD